MRPLSRVVLGLVTTVLLGCSPIVGTASSTSGPISTPPAASAVSITGLDLHDGTIQKFGSTYYMYGTMYGCGFNWNAQNTPWCGFGVSTANSLSGPWSTPSLLFSPSDWDSFADIDWQQECGATGAGCFNPRMVQRTWGPNDGVYLLWFNAPADFNRSRANAYYVMGCNGPAGRCGDQAGAPHGSTRKPPLYICGGNGDLTIALDSQNGNWPYIFCTNADQTLSVEKLDQWGTTGMNQGLSALANLHDVEAPGVYRDASSGQWILTYSDPNCGYCAGDGTGYAVSSSLSSGWSYTANSGAAAPFTGRRDISATSCGGQPRTVFTIPGDGSYQWIDNWGVWNGNWTNQANAGVTLVKLQYLNVAQVNGDPLRAEFATWPCG